MIKELNRAKLLDNLQYRMGMTALTATELENMIGVYNGYISRMKSDPQKLPALDIAWKMAQAMAVSLEWLIDGTPGFIDRDGSYLYRFQERLFNLTSRRELVWTEHNYAELNSLIAAGKNPGNLPFLWTVGGQVLIHSAALQECEEIHLKSAVYSAPLDSQHTLWLLSLDGTLRPEDDERTWSKVEWIELTMTSQDKTADPALITSTVMPGGDYLEYGLRKLWQEVVERSADLVLDSEVRNALDAFMERTADICSPRE